MQMPFGKHRGMEVEDCPKSYLRCANGINYKRCVHSERAGAVNAWPIEVLDLWRDGKMKAKDIIVRDNKIIDMS